MPRICNGHDEAAAALRGSEHDLRSPDYAACHAGVNYYQAVLDRLRAEFPETPFTFTLCCGDDPATAHDALRMGFSRIRIRCSEGIFSELEQVGRATGATVLRNA